MLSKSPTKQASAASCNASTVWLWNLRSDLNCPANSLINLWKGNFLISKSVDFWNFLISLKATSVCLGLFLLKILFGLFIAVFNLFVLGLRNKVNDKEFIGLIKFEQDFIFFIF